MKHISRLGRCLLLWLCCAGIAAAQTVSPSTIIASTNPKRRGTGNLSVAYQSYHNRANGRTVENVQGAAVSFRHFFPRHGLFSLQLEPLVDRGGLVVGENSAQWKGLPWKGRHWDFAVGDFRTGTALVEVPFTNLSLPELYLRGGKATARTEHWRYSFYGGVETLPQGNRVPFRVRVPQNALGVEAAGKLPRNVEVGFRFLRLASSPRAVATENLFFPPNRQLTRSLSFTTQANVPLTETLQWYTEAGLSSGAGLSAAPGRSSQFSLVSGPAWHTSRFSFRANYTRQGTGYLPVLGYYLGDRRGPNVEGVLHLGRLNLSGSWLQSRNNLERRPDVPDFFSRQSGGGFNLRLPLDVFLSGSISKIHLESRSPESGFQVNDNRQYQLMVSRPLFRHNLHATWQRMDIRFRNARQQLEFLEIADNYTWKRFTAGGAVRWQRFFADQHKESLFFRSSAQLQLRNISLYGYWEQGKDLANSTLFATNVFSTSVAGLSWEVPRKMTARIEVFRTQLKNVLNPESIFVLGSRGITGDTILNRSNDWSLFLRVTREFDWGEPLTLDSRGLSQQEAPLLGMLAGFVKLRTLAGPQGAADVWVVLDSGRTAKTDENGYFQIPEIPQGPHLVSLDLDRLPADFNPTEQKEASVLVRAGQPARVDLEVTPLQALSGVVQTREGEPAPEGVVVRLSPTDQYTTTDRAGRFGFYNLPEGDYIVTVVEDSLPERARLVTPNSLPVAVRYGVAAAPAAFGLEVILPGPKPVRDVFQDRQQTASRPAASRTAVPQTKEPPARARRVIVHTTARNNPNGPVR